MSFFQFFQKSAFVCLFECITLTCLSAYSSPRSPVDMPSALAKQVGCNPKTNALACGAGMRHSKPKQSECTKKFGKSPLAPFNMQTVEFACGQTFPDRKWDYKTNPKFQRICQRGHAIWPHHFRSLFKEHSSERNAISLLQRALCFWRLPSLWSAHPREVQTGLRQP